jgi:predicted MPP superfamily phosphohydrolase
MRVRRRDLLRGGACLGVTATAGAAIDGTCVTPFRLDVSRHSLAPAGADGPVLRVAQVSDLHLHSIGPREEAVIAALGVVGPDLLVLTGDSIDRPDAIGILDDFLGACPSAPARLAIIGNWEYKSGVGPDRLRDLHERHGFDFLVNRSVTVRHAGRTVRVTGLDDHCHGRPDAAAALAAAEPVARHLVLAHCPAAFDASRLPEGHGADAMLSGHTHGGQVAPGGICLVTPPGSGRYVAGWYGERGMRLFVSRGIGNSLLPVRIGSVPELAVIDWHLGAG